ncbi:cobalamin biosynthesis protein CbiG [Roseospira goensis]|uniref:Cobalamin biosynthesis protein CbiG n=1 Tax=Roseospira goensis TaxID=391922 RepID=A0A7W6RWE7_9PROT|nr:cobalamin biosynthesis protein CbiG [Roseospira goensis]MBB4284465.1 hypothetical protein [Roseospira goensis]
MFDTYIGVDFSAASSPVTGRNSLWIAARDRAGAVHTVNPPTRHDAADRLVDLVQTAAGRRRVLVGLDFAFGFPTGFLGRLLGGAATWRDLWGHLVDHLGDAPHNANTRFALAADLNRTVSGRAFPFWGCPPGWGSATLGPRRPAGFDTPEGLPALRLTDRPGPGGLRPQAVWKLAYAGAVGGQTLVGLAWLERLRRRLAPDADVRVWPFETGLHPPVWAAEDAGARPRVVLAEVYPRLFAARVDRADPVPDRAQAQAVAAALAEADADGRLASWFAGPAACADDDRHRIEAEEAWMLGRTDLPAPASGARS